VPIGTFFADACGARPLIKSGKIGPREADDNLVLGEIEGAQLSAPSHSSLPAEAQDMADQAGARRFVILHHKHRCCGSKVLDHDGSVPLID
jgi:hypothetical protein